MAFTFNGTQYTRFSAGGVAETPTEYTLAAWINPKSKTNRSICTRSNNAPGSSWTHQIRTSATTFEHYFFDGGLKTLAGTTLYSVNKWYHVAITAKNSGISRLYVDGREEGTPIAVGTLWGSGNDFWVSVATGGGYSAFDGELAEFCIWYKELTPQEILTIASKVRFAPLQVQKQHIRLYLPMNDVWSGNLVSSNWIDLSQYSNTQTRTGTPTCIGDEISYP